MGIRLKNAIKIGNVDEPGLLNLSNSKAKKWRRCQMSWKYRNVDKLVKRKQSLALSRGSWVHECLESFYSQGDWEIGYSKYKQEKWDNLFEEEKFELGDLPNEVKDIIGRYMKYNEQWHNSIEILGVEVPFQIRVPGTPIVLAGKKDLIYRDHLGIWAADHKTMKTMPGEDFRMTDTQLTLYYYVLNKIAPELGMKPNEKIAGIVYNYIRTKLPTVPEVLVRGGLSKRKNIDTDYDTYYKAILDNDLNPADYQDILEMLKGKQFKYFDRRLVPKSQHLVKNIIVDMINTGYEILNANHYVRNFTKDCSWDCEYYNICYAEVFGQDPSLIIEADYELEDKEEWEVENGKEEDNE